LGAMEKFSGFGVAVSHDRQGNKRRMTRQYSHSRSLRDEC
jgi:hypothetical protein